MKGPRIDIPLIVPGLKACGTRLASSIPGMKILSFFLLIILLASCSEKSIKDEPLFSPVPGGKRAQRLEPDEKLEPHIELKSAYFDYDKSNLRQDAKAKVRENAAWLKAHPEANVTIEGHCDERGTREYNYRLGAERARVAKDYLIQQGISQERVSTVSYGALDGQSEKTWPRHRRAEFVVVYSR